MLKLGAPEETAQAFIFDADGCVFTERLLEKKKSVKLDCSYFKADIEEEHRLLFEYINSQINKKRPKAIDVLCGSNRQSYEIDLANAITNSTGFFFPVLEKIKDIIGGYHNNVSLDQFLLADVFSNENSGAAFSGARSAPFEGAHPQSPIECSKKLLLYVLIHRLAKKHNDETKLDIYFFDDQENIIGGLYEWFNNDKKLIPANVILHLHIYDGNTLLPSPTLEGLGEVDHEYRETAKLVVKASGWSANNLDDDEYFSNRINFNAVEFNAIREKLRQTRSRDVKSISISTTTSLDSEIPIMDQSRAETTFFSTTSSDPTSSVQVTYCPRSNCGDTTIEIESWWDRCCSCFS